MYDESIQRAVEGLKANEMRYFKTHYDYDFVTQPAAESQDVVDYVNTILKAERGIEFVARPVETSQLVVENVTWTHIFYEDGLGLNVLYQRDGKNPKRAVGFKLSEGMEVPTELSSFRFARQKSKLAGVIRGSYFVIKGDY